jgi:putative DNA primase/helicase
MLNENISSILDNQSLENNAQLEAVPAAQKDMSYQDARTALQQAAADGVAKKQYTSANPKNIAPMVAKPSAQGAMTDQAAHNALSQAGNDALHQYGGEAAGTAAKQYTSPALENTIQQEAIPSTQEDKLYQDARTALQQAAVDALHQYGGEADGAAKKQYTSAANDKKLWRVEPEEKTRIWKNTVKSQKSVKAQTQLSSIKGSLAPADFTDVDEANMLNKMYGHYIRFCKETGWLYYDGMRWLENSIKAHGLVQQMTERQLTESKQLYKLEKSKAKPDDKRLVAIEAYHKFACRERSSGRQAACLTEAQPGAVIDIKELDRDGFLLNTPAGVIDLRSGQMRMHRAEDYITKITSVSPSHINEDIWNHFLDDLTGGDQELQQYLQLVVGMAAIGKVYYEGLIIAIGEGGNGKSTFFGAIKNVLGDYAEMVNPDIFIRTSNINKSAEIVTLKGERLALAAELDTGKSLDAGMLKRISSTDMITARALYKDPIQFMPTHTTVMFSNHLPQVDAGDDGTWDRLVIVPFYTRFRNTSSEIKDYGSYLINHCGGAILQWIIDGAVMFFKSGCKIQHPACVKNAIAKYREENDWLGHFIEDRCVIDPSYDEMSSEMYNTYQAYCEASGEKKRSMHDFKKAMERAGFPCDHRNKGNFYVGISCRLV